MLVQRAQRALQLLLRGGPGLRVALTFQLTAHRLHRSGELRAAPLVRLLERCDAWRRPERFAQMLLACECDHRGRLGLEERPYEPRPRLLQALQWAQAVETAPVAARVLAQGGKGPEIAAAIHEARVAAVKAGMSGPASA